MVQMRDSAAAYTRKSYNTVIVDGASANHSRKPTPERSRAVSVLADVVTKEKRDAICSTNLIDPTWARIKAEIPDSVSARTLAEQEFMRSYIRTAHWKIMLSTYDRWALFVAAAAKHRPS